MTGTIGPNIGFVWGYTPGDLGWGVSSYNPAMATLDAILQLSVKSATLTAPPGSPTNGDRYIVNGPTATGAWAGHVGNVAAWVNGAWSFYAPKDGWRALNVATGGFIYHTGTAWTNEPSAPMIDPGKLWGNTGTAATTGNDISIGAGLTISTSGTVFTLDLDLTYAVLPSELANIPVAFPFSGKPLPGQQVFVPVVQDMQLPADFTGTIGYSDSVASGASDCVLSLIHSGTMAAIGTVTFSNASHAGTLSTQGSVDVVTGDILVFSAPVVQDALLANVGVTFMFKKV